MIPEFLALVGETPGERRMLLLLNFNMISLHVLEIIRWVLVDLSSFFLSVSSIHILYRLYTLEFGNNKLQNFKISEDTALGLTF